jgi:hypothetical protein
MILRCALLALGLAVAAQSRTLSIVGYAGPTSPDGHWNPSLSWDVHALWNVDQMVMLGPGLGYESGKDACMPLTGRLMVRLPVGRQAMPFIDGEMGAGIRNVLTESELAWKAGVGIDQKLGDRSSLLLGGGFQFRGRYYLRTGLLLEF